VLLVTAMIGDLFLFPAMLAGPLGRWFKPRTSASGSGPSAGSHAGPSFHHRSADNNGLAVVAAAGDDGAEEAAVIASGAHRPPPTPKGNRPGGSRQPVSGEQRHGADGHATDSSDQQDP